jgi:hypothetical protein
LGIEISPPLFFKRKEKNMAEDISEIIDVYDQYIALLGQEIDNMMGLCFVHGYRETSEAVKKGIELRQKIASFKKVNNDN